MRRFRYFRADFLVTRSDEKLEVPEVVFTKLHYHRDNVKNTDNLNSDCYRARNVPSGNQRVRVEPFSALLSFAVHHSARHGARSIVVLKHI